MQHNDVTQSSTITNDLNKISAHSTDDLGLDIPDPYAESPVETQ